jgi:hypothetical protein
MARSYANLATAIWRDEQWRLLSGAAQLAYLMLMSQSDISAAGVLSLNLTRWASRTKDVTKASLRLAIEELEAHRFVVVDDETEELLVRSFVRWDNGYSNPKRSPVIRDAIGQIESTALLRVLAEEIERLGLVDEKWKSAFPQLNRLSDRHPDGVSASERVVVATASTTGPSSPTPQSTSLVPLGSAEPRVAALKRATRLPEDFARTGITPELVVWARENTPDVNGSYETAKFVDYWLAKPGKDGTKLDWPRTWKNWMRKAQERCGPVTRRLSTADQRAGDAAALASKFAEEPT